MAPFSERVNAEFGSTLHFSLRVWEERSNQRIRSGRTTRNHHCEAVWGGMHCYAGVRRLRLWVSTESKRPYSVSDMHFFFLHLMIIHHNTDALARFTGSFLAPKILTHPGSFISESTNHPTKVLFCVAGALFTRAKSSWKTSRAPDRLSRNSENSAEFVFFCT